MPSAPGLPPDEPPPVPRRGDVSANAEAPPDSSSSNAPQGSQTTHPSSIATENRLSPQIASDGASFIAKESSKRKESPPVPQQQFASDGSFLASFLQSMPSASSKSPTPGSTTASVAPPAPPPARKRRRFQEEPPTDHQQSFEGNSRESESGTSNRNETVVGSGANLMSAELRALEAVANLGDYSEVEDPRNRDTYEEALETGGTITGGTWEHRRRALEMIKTANLADTISSLHAERNLGKSLHGYLPDTVLAAFNEKVEAVKTGLPSANNLEILSTQGAAIDKSNRGFKLLQKSGWTEGQGLGATSSGILTPIPAKAQTVIGEASPSEPTKGDDEFEQYRKRMMLAYRFRPNPLNNPRRSYDGYKTVYDPAVLPTLVAKLKEDTTSPSP